MNVLLVPYNIASKAAITVDALNQIEGINARGLFLGGSKYQAAGRNNKIIHPHHFKPDPLKWISFQASKFYYFEKMIRWADVIHWIWDSAFAAQLDLRYAALLNKPGVIEWSGSDIRYPEKAEELNPYMRDVYKQGYEYAHIESKAASFKVQKRFELMGYFPLTTPEMDLYIRKDLFPKSYKTLHRLNIGDFKPEHPVNPRPIVVHAPTQRVAKGTSHILAAVEILKKELDFEFTLLENLPRHEALKVVQHCDIFIDQLILGSYGLASCEAMAFGKPVICYIMPAVFENGLPRDCPVLNATPDTITDQLRLLLTNSALRSSIGAQGRVYAETYLDAGKAAYRFAEMYREVIGNNKIKKI